MAKHKKAEGGGISKAAEAQSGPHQEETNKKKTETMKQPDEFKGKERAERVVKVEKAKGGEVAKKEHKRVARKSGGMVPGSKGHHRLDKKARGGAAKSPLSGADAPNMPYAHGNLKVDAHNKGKDTES